MEKIDKVLVTGAAGFIGFHLSKRLAQSGFEVTGIDNLDEYYDVNLKKDRLKVLAGIGSFSFKQMSINDTKGLKDLFDERQFTYVVNLAAQAGVRYSITNPDVYIQTNVVGFLNVLEACRHHSVRHLVYASSSSVYGGNRKMPFSVADNVDHPLSLYAATKKANELMAHSYSSMYDLPTTGVRFFSAYGPYGRPDMALYMFTKAILEGRTIDVYNDGWMKRDFTYVDDITECVKRLLTHIPVRDNNWDAKNPYPATSFAPYQIFNAGNNDPIELTEFIDILEKKIGKKAIRRNMAMQVGDVPESFAEVGDLFKAIDFKPATSVELGVSNFVDWYRSYYNV